MLPAPHPTTIAVDDPEHVLMAAQLLGHATLQTTERHYVAANTRAALDRHHDLIRTIRKSASPQAGQRRRRRKGEDSW